MAQVSENIVDFYGLISGLNTVKSAVALASTEARNLQDVDLFPIGGFSKRNGYVRLNNPWVENKACTGLYMARFSTSGGTNVAFLVAGTKMYSMPGSLNGTWTSIKTGLTDNANYIWNFDILNDTVVSGNGVDTPVKINSSGTASNLSGAGIPFTTFRFPIQSRGYMFYFVPTVSGDVEYDRCYFSSINDPATVGTNDYIDVSKRQGGIVTGAVDYKTFLYVWKRSGIYQLIFQPTQINSSGDLFPWIQNPNPVISGVGTQSHRSIVKFTTPETHVAPGQELVFFIDQFGVPRIFDGVTTISLNSKIGFSRDSGILSLSNMDMTRAPYCFSINYPSKNKILCFMSQKNSLQDTCWVLDYTTGFAITRYKFFDGFNVGCLFEKVDGTFKPFVADYAGTAYELDSGTTDNGNAINDYYLTGDNFLKSPSLNSKWTWLTIRGVCGDSAQMVKVSFLIDGADSAISSSSTTLLQNLQTKWGAFKWGQAKWATNNIHPRTVEINTVSKTLRVRIESNTKLTDTYNIEGFSVTGDILGTRQD
jgi:hypothetical protein